MTRSTKNIRVLLYDAKPYDQDSFESVNGAFGFKFKFLRSHLNCRILMTTFRTNRCKMKSATIAVTSAERK